MTIHTDYLSNVYDRKLFKEKITKSVEILEATQKESPFEAIAFTGTSGAALSYPLAHLLDVSLICVRKPNDESHFINGNGIVEGYADAENIIIVDDFISGGTTVRRILREVKDFYLSRMKKAKKPNLVGILLYGNSHGPKFYKASDDYLESVTKDY